MATTSAASTIRVLTVLALLLIPSHASADENAFGYAYGSETLPKGKWEVYFWLTHRGGKGSGSYQAWDNLNELEYGVTDRLQVSLYLNSRAHRIRNNAEFEDRTSFGFEGVRSAFKFALTNPYTQPLGIALYVEPEYSRIAGGSGERRTEFALETKLILQKHFLSDRVSSVLNLTYEPEWEREHEVGEEVEVEHESVLEVAAGINYRVASNWFVGVEGRRHAGFEGLGLREEKHHAWFAGPTVHYGRARWWLTATLQPQVSGSPSEPSRRVSLSDYERVETRLKIGYNF